MKQIGGAAIASSIVAGAGLIWAHTPGAPLSYEAKRLRALKNDPMGATTILGHHAIHIEESPLPKWFEWKYSGVHLYRWFSDHSVEPEHLRMDFINYAKAHDWNEHLNEHDTWTAYRENVSDSRISLSISVEKYSDVNALQNAVRITLT